MFEIMDGRFLLVRILVRNMDQPISGQTSDEKKNRIFYELKRTAFKFRRNSWGSFKYLTSSSGREGREVPRYAFPSRGGIR